MTTLRISGVAASYGGTTRAARARPRRALRDHVGDPRGLRLRQDDPAARRRRASSTPTTGAVQLGERTVAGPGVWVAPEKRGIGYVAQEGNLFPHLTVGGQRLLRARPARLAGPASESASCSSWWACPPTSRPAAPTSSPVASSSGSRWPAPSPGAPRSCCSTSRSRRSTPGCGPRPARPSRGALAHEDVTVVLVTHDQAEALSFADQVAIMHDGRFSQVGTPSEVYGTPADRHAAAFLGDAVVPARHRRRGRRRQRRGGEHRARPAGGAPAGAGRHGRRAHPPRADPAARHGARASRAPRCCRRPTSATTRWWRCGCEADHTVVTARVNGSDVPPTGSIVGLSVVGEARAFETH